MSVRKQKIKCPICATPFWSLLRPTIIGRGEIMIGLGVKIAQPTITHSRKSHTEIMRCPLCYGKGWIKPELDVVFRFNFAGECDEIKYNDLTSLRLLLSNSVCANEIEKSPEGEEKSERTGYPVLR